MTSTDLTTSEISRSSRRMARPKNAHEPVLIRFVPGTKERVKAVLEDGKDHAHFVRSAVDEKIARRERATRKKRRYYTSQTQSGRSDALRLGRRVVW